MKSFYERKNPIIVKTKKSSDQRLGGSKGGRAGAEGRSTAGPAGLALRSGNNIDQPVFRMNSGDVSEVDASMESKLEGGRVTWPIPAQFSSVVSKLCFLKVITPKFIQIKPL